MGIFLGICIAFSFLALVFAAGFFIFAVISSLFSGPGRFKKGLIAAVLGILFFSA
jgi:hypothetical protein